MPGKKVVFGLNMSHDGSCAAVVDGEVKVAIELERINRQRYNIGRDLFNVPFLAIRYCCEHLGIEPNDVDLWVSSSTSPFAVNTTRSQMLGIPGNKIVDMRLPGHHLAHAYAAYCCSSFEDAAVVVLDTHGGEVFDGLTFKKVENYSIYHGRGHLLEEVVKDFTLAGEMGAGEMYMVYSALLQLTPTADGDYGRDLSQPAGGKLMGFAAYDLGKTKAPDLLTIEGDHIVVKIRDAIKHIKKLRLIEYEMPKPPYDRISGWEIKEHVSFKQRTGTLKQPKYARLGGEAQRLLEQVILRTAQTAYERTGSKNLCLSGGNMLNVVACTEILRKVPFKEIFIHPAANDGGNAIGAAYYGYHEVLKEQTRHYTKHRFSAFLGRTYPSGATGVALQKLASAGCVIRPLSPDKQIEAALPYLTSGGVVAVFKGKSEFGPRALGNRSLLAMATKRSMLHKMNKLKAREWYRPVAPIVMEEEFPRYFDAPFTRAPFMNLSAWCKEDTKRVLPAIAHVDGSARVQTVSEEDHPFVYAILKAYRGVTGLPVLINTSFNIKGEPIVESPFNAANSFLATPAMSCLIMEDNFIERPPAAAPKRRNGKK